MKRHARGPLCCALLGTLLVGSCGTRSAADRWAVPDGLDVRVPESAGRELYIEDPILDTLRAAAPGSEGRAELDTRMPVLASIGRDLAEVERRLARSPVWRVYEEHGRRFAIRMLPGFRGYVATLNGSFYEHALPHTSPLPEFRFRLRMELGADPSARIQSVRVPVGSSVPVPVEPGTRGFPTSHIAIQHGDVLVEIYEESRAGDRGLTRVALAEVERALSPAGTSAVQAAPSTEPDFLLRRMGGGRYELEAWVNPREPGAVEVRAFEFSTNTRLSREPIAQRSRVRVEATVGESRFPTRTEFTIYEGNGGDDYAARIELWFTPDVGRPRKLLERVYRVEGWMR